MILDFTSHWALTIRATFSDLESLNIFQGHSSVKQF